MHVVCWPRLVSERAPGGMVVLPTCAAWPDADSIVPADTACRGGRIVDYSLLQIMPLYSSSVGSTLRANPELILVGDDSAQSRSDVGRAAKRKLVASTAQTTCPAGAVISDSLRSRRSHIPFAISSMEDISHKSANVFSR